MVLDTNVLIAYLNGESSVVAKISDWKEIGRALFISSISIAEVLSLPVLSLDDIRSIKLFLKEFISVPLNDELAETAATIKRVYGLKIPDAAIAATAIENNVPLITRDEQFGKVKELTVVNI